MGSNVIVVPALEIDISSTTKLITTHCNVPSVSNITSHFDADTGLFCIQAIHPTLDSTNLRRVC